MPFQLPGTTPAVTEEPSSFPVAAIVVIAIGGYLVLVVLILVIRSVLLQRGICEDHCNCCGKEGGPRCCECWIAFTDSCNCMKNPTVDSCLDACCPQRKKLDCAEIIMCQCCAEGGCCGMCASEEPICDCICCKPCLSRPARSDCSRAIKASLFCPCHPLISLIYCFRPLDRPYITSQQLDTGCARCCQTLCDILCCSGYQTNSIMARDDAIERQKEFEMQRAVLRTLMESDQRQKSSSRFSFGDTASSVAIKNQPGMGSKNSLRDINSSNNKNFLAEHSPQIRDTMFNSIFGNASYSTEEQNFLKQKMQEVINNSMMDLISNQGRNSSRNNNSLGPAAADSMRNINSTSNGADDIVASQTQLTNGNIASKIHRQNTKHLLYNDRSSNINSVTSQTHIANKQEKEQRNRNTNNSNNNNNNSIERTESVLREEIDEGKNEFNIERFQKSNAKPEQQKSGKNRIMTRGQDFNNTKIRNVNNGNSLIQADWCEGNSRDGCLNTRSTGKNDSDFENGFTTGMQEDGKLEHMQEIFQNFEEHFHKIKEIRESLNSDDFEIKNMKSSCDKLPAYDRHGLPSVHIENEISRIKRAKSKKQQQENSNYNIKVKRKKSVKKLKKKNSKSVKRRNSESISDRKSAAKSKLRTIAISENTVTYVDEEDTKEEDIQETASAKKRVSFSKPLTTMSFRDDMDVSYINFNKDHCRAIKKSDIRLNNHKVTELVTKEDNLTINDLDTSALPMMSSFSFTEESRPPKLPKQPSSVATSKISSINSFNNQHAVKSRRSLNFNGVDCETEF